MKQSINNAINAHQAVRVVYARDTPACPDWQQKPRNALLKAKHQWLSFHDKKCADLPGYLPLSVGAPVRLTQHLHRSPKLKLLKHQQGTVVGWDAHKNEPNPSSALTVYVHMPCVVYVKFDCEPPHCCCFVLVSTALQNCAEHLLVEMPLFIHQTQLYAS